MDSLLSGNLKQVAEHTGINVEGLKFLVVSRKKDKNICKELVRWDKVSIYIDFLETRFIAHFQLRSNLYTFR